MGRIVVLHPGAMGSSVAAALVAAGHETVWVSAGRSEATRQRALEAGLMEAQTLASALADASVVISVCPPEFAHEQARAVAAVGFHGIYVDANAISPETSIANAAMVGEGYVDGGIIGPPARRPGLMRLYLSGPAARDVVNLFADTLVDARAIDGGIGAASALKMCYAAYTKGTSALLLAIRALAEHSGVTSALLAEWALSQPGLGDRSAQSAHNSAPKAWRFSGEMQEISATFAAAGLPGGFHESAAAVYARLKTFKDQEPPALADVVAALLEPGANDHEQH